MPTQCGVLTSHWDAVRGSDISFRCCEAHPISFGRSGEFRYLIRTQLGVPASRSDALRGSSFPPEAVGGCGIPSDAMRSTQFHWDAVRSSDIPLGRSEGFRRLIPMLRGASHSLPIGEGL
jgi:hypothetical protein